jgi:hypothetical protein
MLVGQSRDAGRSTIDETFERYRSNPPEALELSPQQRHYFATFGFLKLPGLFATDLPWIEDEFEKLFADESLASWENRSSLHLHQRRKIIPGFVSHSERLSCLITDPRVDGVVRGLLGDGYEYAESDGNLYWCETAWHCDIYSAPLARFHVKLCFYLEALDGSSGALRVIPGTNHHDQAFARGLRVDVNDPEKTAGRFGVDARDLPSWTIDSSPGDLIVMNFRTLHASFNGGQRRRLFTMNYRESDPEDGSGS